MEPLPTIESAATVAYEYEYAYEYYYEDEGDWGALNQTTDAFKYWTLGVALNAIDVFGVLANIIVVGEWSRDRDVTFMRKQCLQSSVGDIMAALDNKAGCGMNVCKKKKCQ